MKDSPLPHDFNMSFECWAVYKDTGVLPFAGGWFTQPQWLLDDFHYYDVLQEFKALPYQIDEAKRQRERAIKTNE